MTIDDLDHTKRDLYIKIAKMYFLDSLSQEEISKKVNLSRSHISKILKICRERKIVEIRVNDTSSLGIFFQEEIKKRFDIENIIVVPSEKDIETTKIQIGKASASLLSSMLRDKVKIGISWGSTLYHTVAQFSPVKYLDTEVIQLVGGTGAYNLATDGLELARTLAHKINAACSVLQAPLIVQSKELRNMLVQEPGIVQVLEKAAKVDIALLGVGTNVFQTSSLFRAGFLTEEESRNLLTHGVVGDICGKQIDINGNMCNTDLNNRIIGIDLEALKRIPHRICIAGGSSKADTILGSLRGGYINSLVIDEDAAMRILTLIRELE